MVAPSPSLPSPFYFVLSSLPGYSEQRDRYDVISGTTVSSFLDHFRSLLHSFNHQTFLKWVAGAMNHTKMARLE